MRQFIYGVLCGVGFWLAWEKSDPVAMFRHLNNLTADAAKSTVGYRH